MERLILGTAGHIDHGKTTLVRALTGVDTDRLPEEKRRGITIDLGFAALDLPDGTRYGIVDVPGHEAFVRNMLAGASGVDVALLVVAADEGVMPQTREHTAILEMLGVPSLVVALTKCDMVDEAWRDLAMEDVRALLVKTAWPDAPVVAVSGSTGTGLDALRAALADAAGTARERQDDDLFRMPVDRVFTVHGTGTVVTGTIWSGRVQRDDQLRLLPSGAVVRVRGVQTHGAAAVAAGAGERAALALAGVDRDAVTRGDTLTSDRAWQPSDRLTVRLAVLPAAGQPIRSRQRVRMHLGTAEIMARVSVLDGAEIAPGEARWAQLRLERPIAARARDRVVIRSYSPVTTIGGGVVAEPDPPRRTRLRAEDAPALDALLGAEAATAAAARTALDAWSGSARATLPIRTGWPERVLDYATTASPAVHVTPTKLFAAALFDEARARIRAALDDWHAANPIEEGCDREVLRRALPAHADPALLHAALARLENDGVVTVSGATYARTGWRPELSPASEARLTSLREELRAAGLESRAAEELSVPLATHPDSPALLRLLERRGEVVAIAPGRYVSSAALSGGIAAARQSLGGREPLGPGDFRDVWNVSRKHLIPLLEYLDRTGTTERAGDGRRLRALEGTSDEAT